MNFQTINKKALGLFLPVLLSIFCLGSLFGCTPSNATAIPEQSNDNKVSEELLVSWNDEADSKQAIIEFVNKVIDDNIPVKDRIAVFDNDGTLWAERPHYFQEDFINNRLSDAATDKVSELVKITQKEIDETGGNPISEEGKIVLDEIGLTTDEYNTLARSFLDNIHSDMASKDDGDFQRFDTEYINLTYKPVIELVNYLKANQFKVYICSGGGIYFVRSFSDEAYGIPTEEVIGSAIKTAYDDSNNTIVRQLGLAHYDDQEGKPVGIELFIGKRPLVAVGNSSGDFEMFKYTDSGVGNSLIVLINHDDCDREYEYNDVVGSTHEECDRNGENCQQVPDNESLDYAQNHENWIVASMKEDFKTIFESNPSRTPPMCN